MKHYIYDISFMLRFVYYRWASKLTYLLRLNHETLKYKINKDMNKECSKDLNESCIIAFFGQNQAVMASLKISAILLLYPKI